MTEFRRAVYEVVRGIPKGSVMTYKAVAAAAGRPNAARAVGSAMKQNFNRDIPCHRVVRSDDKVGQYNRGGEIVKTQMLQDEGVSR